jgi:hypothetical protein
MHRSFKYGFTDSKFNEMALLSHSDRITNEGDCTQLVFRLCETLK